MAELDGDRRILHSSQASRVLYPELRVVLPQLRPEREEYRLRNYAVPAGRPSTLSVTCCGSGPLSPADREVQRALESLPALYRALGETLKWLHRLSHEHPELTGLAGIYHMNRKVAEKAGVKLREK